MSVIDGGDEEAADVLIADHRGFPSLSRRWRLIAGALCVALAVVAATTYALVTQRHAVKDGLGSLSTTSVGFPAQIYPAPTAPRWNPPLLPARPRPRGMFEQCPSAAGLQPTGTGDRHAAVSTVQMFGLVSLDSELHHSDRALWAFIRGAGPLRPSPTLGRTTEIVLASPLASAGGSSYTDLRAQVTRACGATIASDSFVVISGPPSGSALQSATLLIKRQGRLLAWLVVP
jgi:hypothetical protein